MLTSMVTVREKVEEIMKVSHISSANQSSACPMKKSPFQDSPETREDFAE